jgi:clan AA aspartic protease
VGTFKQRIELAATPDGPFRGIYALVDTGSVYTWVPGRILEELGLSPSEHYDFVMANGEKVRRGRTEAVIRLDGRTIHTLCVYGDDTDQTLLGAYTLEGFALAVDPVKKRLIPMAELPAASTEPEGGMP